MFNKIYINPQRSMSATNVSRTTLYRWLNGALPKLYNLATLKEKLNIDIGISYVIEFNKTALQLNSTHELAKVKEITDASKLFDVDKALLSKHHKNRIWREIGKEPCDEETSNG